MFKKKEKNLDRTLVLRIYDERLQARLREKMAALEDEITAQTAAMNINNNRNPNNSNNNNYSNRNAPPLTTPKQESKLLDLPGVSFEPALQKSNTYSNLPSSTDATLWNFHCDGATYPARLTNLPCPVELHKTHDHAMYYKCANIAQMLIVYEDKTAMEEAESMPKYKVDGFPSYYHSGLTPPAHRIVQKRFKSRVHAAIPPVVEEIQKVEKEMLDMMEQISSKDTNKQKKNPRPALNKVLEEVEECVVKYEPWMDSNGDVPQGIQFSEEDDICNDHPEIWLFPEDLVEEEKVESAAKKAVVSPTVARRKSPAPDAPFAFDTNASESGSMSSSKMFAKSGDVSVASTAKSKKKKTTKKKSKKTKKKEVKEDPPEQKETKAEDLDLIDLDMNTLDHFDLDDMGVIGDDELFMM